MHCILLRCLKPNPFAEKKDITTALKQNFSHLLARRLCVGEAWLVVSGVDVTNSESSGFDAGDDETWLKPKLELGLQLLS